MAALRAAKPAETKYKLQNVNLVCTWRFGAGFNDTCYIDKTSLYEQSLDGQANNIEDQSHDSWFISTGAPLPPRPGARPPAGLSASRARRGVRALLPHGQHQEVHPARAHGLPGVQRRVEREERGVHHGDARHRGLMAAGVAAGRVVATET